jgi:hypothetical protein
MKKFVKIRYVNRKSKRGEGQLHATSTFGNPIEFSSLTQLPRWCINIPEEESIVVISFSISPG